MVLFRRQVSQNVFIAVTRGLFISRSDTKSTADHALHLVSIRFTAPPTTFMLNVNGAIVAKCVVVVC